MPSPEPFAFTKHLRALVRPQLAAGGFRMSGTKFLRPARDYAEAIYFQRSPMNFAGAASVFYLNIGLETDRKRVSGYGRLAAVDPSKHDRWEYSSEDELNTRLVEANQLLTLKASSFFRELGEHFERLQTIADTLRVCAALLGRSQ
jgi:hypothetical protein